MLKNLLFSFALMLLSVVSAQAAGFVLPGPLPASVIIQRGGFDWAWVSPCIEDRDSCSLGTETYGFAAPTSAAQWTNSFTGYPDMLNAFLIFNNANQVIGVACASPYFNQDNHDCHSGDMLIGAVQGSPFPPPPRAFPIDYRTNLVAEMLWLRVGAVIPPPVVPDPVPPTSVPESSSLLLLGIGLLGLVAWRHKAA